MQVQVNTSHDIHGSQKFHEFVQTEIEAALERFAPHLTRVEVHFTDENGDKEIGEDKRCVIEARPAGAPPVSVTHMAGSVDLALEGAAEKMGRLLEARFGKLHSAKGGVPTRDV